LLKGTKSFHKLKIILDFVPKGKSTRYLKMFPGDQTPGGKQFNNLKIVKTFSKLGRFSKTIILRQQGQC